MYWVTIVLFVTMVLFACEAPHNNPLDPNNPNYKFGRISGSVQTISLPLEPVAQTVVSWRSGANQTISDNQGQFDLLLKPVMDGWLLFNHPQFHPDSVFVNWPANKEFKVDIFLNTLPKMDSLTIYSVVLNRFPSFQKEELVLKAHIKDRDNDIDSVHAVFFGEIQRFYLPFNTTEKSYQRKLSVFDLGLLSFEDIIGQPVNITVKDIFSNTVDVGQNQLVRVIYEEVIFISPKDTTTGRRPTLIWQQFDPNFDFYYDVEIYTNEVAPQLIRSYKKLAMDQTSLDVDSDLPEGNYFWVIWAIDSFGNRTRSKPAAFSVMEEI